MALYAFDANFQLLGLAADNPVNYGTVDTGAVDLSKIGKVDPVGGGNFYTLPQKPRNFTVSDMPLGSVVVTITTPLPTTTSAFPQKARCTLAASHVLPNAAWTQVVWDTLATNPARVGVQLSLATSTMGAGALLPQTAGQYIVTGCVTLLAGATYPVLGFGVRILINGVVQETFMEEDSLAINVKRGVQFNGVFDLNVGDYVTLQAFANSSESVSMQSALSWFSIVQVH